MTVVREVVGVMMMKRGGKMGEHVFWFLRLAGKANKQSTANIFQL